MHLEARQDRAGRLRVGALLVGTPSPGELEKALVGSDAGRNLERGGRTPK
jgi:hypothetical protein